MNLTVYPHCADVTLPAQLIYDLYCFADATVRFRFYVEWAYLIGAEGDGDQPRPLPSSVCDMHGELLRTGELTAAAVPNEAGTVVREVMQQATSLDESFQRTWDSEEHKRFLALLREQTDDFQHEEPVRYRLISRSPVRPAAWTTYEDSVTRMACSLTQPLSDVFVLSRTLAATAYPTYAEYDVNTHAHLAYDSRHILGTVSPRITRLLQAVSSRTGFLTGLHNPITAEEGLNPERNARALHDEIRRRLKDAASQVPELQPVHAVPPTTVVTEFVSEALPALTLTAVDLPVNAPAGGVAASPVSCSREEYNRLLKNKRNIDPKDQYIGRSVVTLRVFENITRLNLRPNDPVTIEGLSRTGKTVIAEFVHQNSARAKGLFLRLSASSVRAGDASLRLSRWVGVGRNSFISGARSDAQTDGWLRRAAGGTIFIDELQDLDEDTQQFLRQVFDRTPIQRAAGDGAPVVPDVRLVFATNRPLEELVTEGKLRQDFVNRLRGRVVKIPSLDERKEDIPLFVERFRGSGRRSSLRFLLCLLRHSWEVGQVELLQEAVATAGDAAGPNGELTAESLRGMPALRQTVDAVQTVPETEVEREVLHVLVESLTRQGCQPEDRRSGLGRRLAEITGFSTAKISRLLRIHGFRGEQPEGEPCPPTADEGETQTGCDETTDGLPE